MCARRRHDALPVDPAELLRKTIEAAHGRVEQSHRSAKRAALQVVIRRRELDQTLKKLVDVRFRNQPERLPRFVCVPELLRVETLYALEKVERERGADRRGAPRSSNQRFARAPVRSASQIALVKSAVVPVPPMSRVRCAGPDASTVTIASCTRRAGSISPMCCSISTAD